jgi:hypothetical protein
VPSYTAAVAIQGVSKGHATAKAAHLTSRPLKARKKKRRA